MFENKSLRALGIPVLGWQVDCMLMQLAPCSSVDSHKTEVASRVSLLVSVLSIPEYDWPKIRLFPSEAFGSDIIKLPPPLSKLHQPTVQPVQSAS